MVMSHLKVSRYICRVLVEVEFSVQNFEKFSNLNLAKIRHLGADLFHAERRKDRRNSRQTNRRTDRRFDRQI